MNVEDVWIFPPNGGKFCNPLDNTLWHSMKQRVRKEKPNGEKETATAAKRAFMNISAKALHSYFRNCALTYGTNPYKRLAVNGIRKSVYFFSPYVFELFVNKERLQQLYYYSYVRNRVCPYSYHYP